MQLPIVLFATIVLAADEDEVMMKENPKKEPFKCKEDEVMSPFGQQCLKVCGDQTCGVNAECIYRRGPLCRCLSGYAGNPSNYCYEKPCKSKPCGKNASCDVLGNDIYCQCYKGFVGNALINCWEQGDNICDPNPCGNNTMCIQDPKEACMCLPDYFGAPPNCRKGCLSDDMCGDGQYCSLITNECLLGCRYDGDCESDEYCDTVEFTQKCQKETEYCDESTGECGFGCTFNENCQDNEYCDHFIHRCINPCDVFQGICGFNSVCNSTDHSRNVRCSCEVEFIPTPYQGCQKSFTNQTISNESLDCSKYCIKYAKCELRNEKIECFCPDDSFTILDPFATCIIKPPINPAPPLFCAHANRPECAVPLSSVSNAIIPS